MGTAQNTDRLLRMKEITVRFGISESTIRRATASGALATYRTQGNHRRVSESDLRAFMLRDQGGDQGENSAEEKDSGCVIPIFAIARVSSAKQAAKNGSAECSSLEHQRQRVQAFIDERFAGKPVRVKWYVAQTSGMNYSAKHIVELISDLLEGRCRNGFVVAQSSDRILRFGHALIEKIAEHGGAKVLYAMESIHDDELVTDVLSVITHFTARNSARRSAVVVRRNLPTETLERALKMLRDGGSLLGTYETLKREGLLIDQKGRTISYRSLQRRLDEARPVLDRTLGKAPKRNSFASFMRRKLRPDAEAVIKRTAIFAAYEAYCRTEGLNVISPLLIAQTWKEAGLTTTRTGGCTRYFGMAFAD